MGKFIDKVVVKENVEKILNSDVSKSEKMRQLFLEGVEVKAIADMMNVRYNFVYNVVSNLEFVNDEVRGQVKKTKVIGEKKEEIIKLLNDGKSIAEVCRMLNCVYNYVWKINKEGIADGKIKVK